MSNSNKFYTQLLSMIWVKQLGSGFSFKILPDKDTVGIYQYAM